VAKLTVRELIDAGIHFGHRASRWDPKMAPYIYGKRNLIHIIDLKETVKGIVRAKRFLTQVVAEGRDVLFVATKRQAKAIIQSEAGRANMPFVSERWLGGMLTNFRTIRERLKYLEQLEQLERSGEIQTYSKKMISKINREMRKIRRNLDGVRTMNRLPGSLFVVDPRREHIAVREARRLGIPTVALMDSDSDPDKVDIVIPGNDDAMRAIEIVAIHMADAVVEGLANRAARPMTAERMKEVAPEETVPSRRPRGRQAPRGRTRRGAGRGGRKRDEKRGPDPSQIAERGAPRRVEKPEEAKPQDAKPEEKPAEADAAAAQTPVAAPADAQTQPAQATPDAGGAKTAATPVPEAPKPADAAEAKPTEAAQDAGEAKTAATPAPEAPKPAETAEAKPAEAAPDASEAKTAATPAPEAPKPADAAEAKPAEAAPAPAPEPTTPTPPAEATGAPDKAPDKQADSGAEGADSEKADT